jgi:hypothetical protein
MIDKIKLWLKATGLGNLAWAGGAIGSFILIGGSLGAFIAGVCAGLFVYFNFDIIKGLIKGIKE